MGFLLLIFGACGQQCCQKKDSSQDGFTYLEFDIAKLRKGYDDGSFTIRDVVKAYLDRIEKIDRNGPAINSIIAVNPDAVGIAEELDRELREGKSRGPMHGIPVLLKDNIDTHDRMPTTAGSRALMNSFPLQDSYIAKKLREAGAVIIGKTNLSEWANFRGQLSTSGWSGVGGLTRNPYVLSRNPCGSSSGSGAAVSANLAIVAIGTETNGSIVCPSTANGIVGIKPTVGLLSRSGIIPISFTQDTPGPMARTVTDAAICLGVLTGIDASDTKTLDSEGRYYADYTQFLKKDGLKGKRIGLYKAPLGRHFKVDSLVARTVETMKNLGAEFVDIDEIPLARISGFSLEVMLYEFKDGLNKYFVSLGPDAPIKNLDELIAFNLNDSIELRYFNQDYLLRANKKGDLNSEEYKRALASMLKGMRDDGIDRVMNLHRLDAIIAPTGSPAWHSDLVNGDSFHVGSSSPAAQAGYPNITVPMGFIEQLPVGISIFGRAWSEHVLIEIAYAFEQATLVRKPPRFLKSDF